MTTFYDWLDSRYETWGQRGWSKGSHSDDWRLPDLQAAWDFQQAKIDRLMLDYCPEEMTAAQREEWEKHQKPVPDDAQFAASSSQSGDKNVG